MGKYVRKPVGRSVGRTFEEKEKGGKLVMREWDDQWECQWEGHWEGQWEGQWQWEI